MGARFGLLPIALLAWLFLTGAETIETPHQAVTLANQAYGDGRFRDAADLYEAALVGLPDAPELYFNQGNAYFKLHDLEKALAAYSRALETQSHGLAAMAHYNIGNVRYQIALNAMHTFRDAVTPIRDAMRSYREALALDPGLADAMYNLELADRLSDELDLQRRQMLQHPDAELGVQAQNRSDVLDDRAENNPSTDRQIEAEESPEGQSGDAQEAPESMPSPDDVAKSQPDSSQRELTAEEAEEMVEMVRSKAEEAEKMRQQWRQARMREAGIARPW